MSAADNYAIALEGESLYEQTSNRPCAPDYEIDALGCWVWQKQALRNYPIASPHGRAHRIYYQLANGPVPKGAHIHHVCRNTLCVNPEHLEYIDARKHWEGHFLNERGGISLEDVREIRRLGRLDGQSAAEVAKQFGIDRWTVRMYWTHCRWAEELGEHGPARPPVRICELEGCENPVIGRRDKRFCCKPHQAHHGPRKTTLSFATTSEELSS